MDNINYFLKKAYDNAYNLYGYDFFNPKSFTDCSHYQI